MLRKKMEEIELYNSTINQPYSNNILQNRHKRYKCFKCRQRGHVMKNCPVKKHDEGKQETGNTSETAKEINEGFMTTKPTVSLKYPEWIHFSTKCMIKGTDQGHWDDIWYISNNTNIHLCSKLNLFCNIKESFAVNKLDDQIKFLFIYGIGEVVVKNGDQGYLIPGVHYAPEVTLNILSIEQLERQGIDIIYEDNTCRLSYMFSNPNDHKFNEDKLRIMQNEFLENYFDSLEKGDTSVGMKTDGMLSVHNDLIEIKESNGKIGEILGLSIQDGEEVRKCYINFLDVFTSYYKTARVPKQEHNTVLSMPTETVEKGKEYTCPAFHQCDFGDNQAPNKEATSTKGKEKIEHFGIILEDARRDEDSHQIQPILPNIKRSQTKDKDLQGMIKTSINSDKTDTNNSSSDDFTIIA
ncbi:ARID DNA-binding domain-containing protein [Tanacetum coccineum]